MASVKVYLLNEMWITSCGNREEQWTQIKQTIRSWELSGHERLETIFHAIMRISEPAIIQILLENGFEESSEAAAAARKQIIELLMEPGFPGNKLVDFLVDLTIEERPIFQRISRSWSTLFSGPLTRYSTYFLAIDGDKQIELSLLYRSMKVNEYCGRHCDYTLLGFAVANNDLRVTRLLLNHGADVNIGKGSSQPLHIAVIIDTVSCAIFKLLLSQKNVNVNILNSDGRTPVQIAVYEKRWEKMTLLVQHGADLDIDYGGDAKKGSVLHFLVLRGIAKKVERLLKHGAYVDRPNMEGQTPLHVAAVYERGSIAKLLIEYGATTDYRDTEGATPLILAATYGSVEVLKILLRGNTTIDSPETEDTTAATSSFVIQSEVKGRGSEIQTDEIKFDNESNGDENRADQVKFEINGTAQKFPQKTQTVVDGRDNKGATAMYYAAEAGYTQIVEILLSQGANPDIADNTGITPLRRAVERKRWDVANKLLEYGANPNMVNCESFTALSTRVVQKASSEWNYFEAKETTYRLLDHGADIRSLVGHIAKSLHPIDYDITALRTALEYELITDLGWLKQLCDAISNYGQNRLGGGTDALIVLAEYILKLKAAGILTIQHPDDGELEGFLQSLTLEILKDSPSFKFDSEKYEEEVTKMTGVIGGSNITIHDLLLKSSDQLAKLARNEVLVQTLKSAVSRFPLYAGILQGRLEKGLLRRRRLNAACRVCHLIFCHVRRVPCEVTERVVMNLDDQELRRFVLDHKRDSFWQNIEKQRTQMRLSGYYSTSQQILPPLLHEYEQDLKLSEIWVNEG